MAPQTRLVDEFVILLVAKAKLTHYLSPRFPPVFSRGDNCPHCATNWLQRICAQTQLTLKIVGQSFFSVLSRLAMAAWMALTAPKSGFLMSKSSF